MATALGRRELQHRPAGWPRACQPLPEAHSSGKVAWLLQASLPRETLTGGNNRTYCVGAVRASHRVPCRPWTLAGTQHPWHHRRELEGRGSFLPQLGLRQRLAHTGAHQVLGGQLQRRPVRLGAAPQLPRPRRPSRGPPTVGQRRRPTAGRWVCCAGAHWTPEGMGRAQPLPSDPGARCLKGAGKGLSKDPEVTMMEAVGRAGLLKPPDHEVRLTKPGQRRAAGASSPLPLATPKRDTRPQDWPVAGPVGRLLPAGGQRTGPHQCRGGRRARPGHRRDPGARPATPAREPRQHTQAWSFVSSEQTLNPVLSSCHGEGGPGQQQQDQGAHQCCPSQPSPGQDQHLHALGQLPSDAA